MAHSGNTRQHITPVIPMCSTPPNVGMATPGPINAPHDYSTQHTPHERHDIMSHATEPEPVVVIDLDIRADAWLFRSQVDAAHGVIKSAGHDTPYLATRHAADVREVNEAYHTAHDALARDDVDSPEIYEEAHDIARSRLEWWETRLSEAGYSTEYISETGAWIIYADEDENAPTTDTIDPFTEVY